MHARACTHAVLCHGDQRLECLKVTNQLSDFREHACGYLCVSTCLQTHAAGTHAGCRYRDTRGTHAHKHIEAETPEPSTDPKPLHHCARARRRLEAGDAALDELGVRRRVVEGAHLHRVVVRASGDKDAGDKDARAASARAPQRLRIRRRVSVTRLVEVTATQWLELAARLLT
jgi:hypothetical protein